MAGILFYLCKMIICSGVMLLYYFLFLRNKRFHQFNRFYLLFSVALSLVLPALHFSFTMSGDRGGETSYMQMLDLVAITSVQPKDISIGYFDMLIIFSSYSLVVLAKLTFDILSLNKIRIMRKTNSFEHIDNIRLYRIEDPGAPFTFLNNIFWPHELSLHSDVGRQLFYHERVHASQGHTYDVLLMRVVLALVWLNPFYYFISKELLLIHEFMADEEASTESNRNDYAECLLFEAIQQKRAASVVNQFYYSSFKRRIFMLVNSFKQDRLARLRRLMVIPMIAMLFIILAFRGQTKPENTNKLFSIENSDAKGDIEDASYPGGPEAWIKYLFKAVHYPKEAEDKQIQGTVVVQFKVDIDGRTSEVSAVEGPRVGGLRAEATRVIKESGKWIPAQKNGRPISSYKKQPIRFVLEVKK